MGELTLPKDAGSYVSVGYQGTHYTGRGKRDHPIYFGMRIIAGAVGP